MLFFYEIAQLALHFFTDFTNPPDNLSRISIFIIITGIPLPDTDSSTVRITNGKVRIGWPAVNYAVSYRLHVAPINKNGTSIDVLTNSAEFASLRPSTLYIINVRPVFGWGLGSIFIKNLNVRTPGEIFALLEIFTNEIYYVLRQEEMLRIMFTHACISQF